jgi:hypothetical protein
MDSLHLHLILNHVPVVGSAGAAVLLAAGLLRRSRDLTIAGLVAFVVVAVITIPVYLTGEPAEEGAEHLPGVTEALIERHEDAAFGAMIAMQLAGALALAGLVWWRLSPGTARSGAFLTLAAGFIAVALIGRAANFGGEIRHTEIRGDATVVQEEDDDDRDGERRRRGRG